jgi:hypothetical protein
MEEILKTLAQNAFQLGMDFMAHPDKSSDWAQNERSKLVIQALKDIEALRPSGKRFSSVEEMIVNLYSDEPVEAKRIISGMADHKAREAQEAREMLEEMVGFASHRKDCPVDFTGECVCGLTTAIKKYRDFPTPAAPPRKDAQP